MIKSKGLDSVKGGEREEKLKNRVQKSFIDEV